MTANLVLGPLFFLGPPTAFWIYGMTDAKRVAEGKKAWGVFPTEKSAAVTALGVMIVFLFSVAFFVQKMDEGKTPAARKKLDQMGIPYTAEAFVGEAEGGNTTAVDLFLAAGMDPDVRDSLRGPALLLAAEKGHTETVHVLLIKGADANAKAPGGDTALMLAGREGHSAIVRALLDKGAYVNAKNYLGMTALTLARLQQHTDIVQLLKQAGARE